VALGEATLQGESEQWQAGGRECCVRGRGPLCVCSVSHTLMKVRYAIMDVMIGQGRSITAIPVPVARALRKLGHDIRDARRRRRIPVAILAQRASISRTTLNKVEKGESGVSLGAYAGVLFALGMIDRLADVADPRHDAIGRELEEEHLPERIRLSHRQKPGEAIITGAE